MQIQSDDPSRIAEMGSKLSIVAVLYRPPQPQHVTADASYQP